ncbi:hypothetical protein [Hydrogenimonas cancrithermarum]|uniref:Uncharacterized protein n=1 Tax=Hydrogenimonas cancrithermarum TaxID=2993563 RepID=A0ABN6X050_9BACT|nr:hypothetical protein [Hydrogenimonas cancrithermarum]BDY13987.1 hypothetical protein HCR_23000 [Hydrogenimonas cancrithermarum]
MSDPLFEKLSKDESLNADMIGSLFGIDGAVVAAAQEEGKAKRERALAERAAKEAEEKAAKAELDARAHEELVMTGADAGEIHKAKKDPINLEFRKVESELGHSFREHFDLIRNTVAISSQ